MTFGSSVVDALHPWVDQIKVLKVVALLHPSVGGERPPEVKSVVCAKKFCFLFVCKLSLSFKMIFSHPPNCLTNTVSSPLLRMYTLD